MLSVKSVGKKSSEDNLRHQRNLRGIGLEAKTPPKIWWFHIKTLYLQSKKGDTIMNTITIDNNTYHDIEKFAHVNNLDVADVVKKSFRFFIEEFKFAKPQSKASQYQLPLHLKKMRGVLAGVEDSEDERLNYILSK